MSAEDIDKSLESLFEKNKNKDKFSKKRGKGNSYSNNEGKERKKKSFNDDKRANKYKNFKQREEDDMGL